MSANVLAFAESRSGDLRRAALEAVTAARTIADASGGEVHAVLFGAPGVGKHAAALGAHGADKVLVVEHAGFTHNNPEAVAGTIAARMANGYRAFVCAASATGKDIAPRVAAKLKVPVASDLIAFEVKGAAIVATHPGYTGKVLQTLSLTATPAVLSVRPGAFLPKENAKAGASEALAPAGDPAASRVKFTETAAGNAAKLDLGEAPVIISGGRGLKEAGNFKLVEDLAAAFGNAAVGATRAVTDDGWRPHADQIGQTGRLVSPDLYVACGISGAIQHLAGMRTSKTIVAINKDKEAPIFKVADYGIVGDALEILPVLTEAVKKAKASG
ncbi:MAG: electron transfer flavoprotein subunit alpha/FixB family protein [Gemmatimonadales bacterium]|nr:electron transfer flavoprotein subunit alpha/FixB family protein [Gemmatimonadales bacterium]